MENGGEGEARWRFAPSEVLSELSCVSVRAVLNKVMGNLEESDPRGVLHLGQGDPSMCPSFRTASAAEDAIVSSLRSAKFNCYAPTVGVSTARCAIADHLSEDLPYKLSPEDVFLTSGCTQAIEIVISVLSRPGANILLPRPGFPFYEARCAFSGLEVRHFNLDPEREWEIDLNMVEAIADGNTVAMVVINPCNPCGSVLSYQHLAKVAETAKKLGIVIIADEVYDHLVFGKKPFVPMGVFGQITPILTLGSISKRWVVPGWRLGWIATSDPKRVLKETKVVQCIESFLNISTDPATFVQGAVPAIIKNTNGDFFNKIIETLRKSSELCCEKLQEIDCITCPSKPEGSMFVLVELNLSCLDGIQDDFEFCCKLAKEESVIILPGAAVGLKNWLRVSFAVELSSLDDALNRLKSFCLRHRSKPIEAGHQ